MINRHFSDKALERVVKEVVLADPVLRALLTYKQVSVEVRDGVVTLRGHASISAHRQMIEHIVRGVPGIQGVANHIITDDRLDIQVAQALAGDPRTRPEMILVNTSRGYVYLSGTVTDESRRTAAEEVAASVSGVRGVVNGIRVRGKPSIPDRPRLLQPAIGSPVYSVDNVGLGSVDRVVINPRTRRLTAVLVEGAFPDPVRSQPDAFPDEWPKQHRTVILPGQHIAKSTIGGTFLNVTALEAADEADVQTGALLRPADAWLPPFPYRVEDVLLAGEHAATPTVELEPATGATAPAPTRSRQPVVRREGALGAVDRGLSDPRRQPAPV